MLTENLFDLFSDEAINWDAASSIGKIAAATDILTKSSYAVTKVCTRSPRRMHTRRLIIVVRSVPCRSEVYERAAATVDERRARVNRCGCCKHAISAELKTIRFRGPDSLPRWTVVTDTGDT